LASGLKLSQSRVGAAETGFAVGADVGFFEGD
jgi:hypothetical protein